MKYLPKKKKKSFNFNQKKENTLNSLSEVETFLRNLRQISKYASLRKFFK